MTYKTFYLNFEKQQFIEKKILSNCVYSKHLIRSDILDSNKTELIDNYSSFTNISIDFPLNLGVSFHPTKFFFKHKHNNLLKFSYFLNFKTSFNNLKSTTKLLTSLKNISISKNSLKLMLILNPVKGGFRTYSCGFLGFLPRSQNKIIFKNILLNRKEQDNTFLSTFLFFFSKNHITKIFFSISLPLRSTITVIYPCYKTSNFSADIAFRRRRFFKNYINFVFLVKTLKKKRNQINQYEDSTIKKQFKSFPYKNKFSNEILLHYRKSVQRRV